VSAIVQADEHETMTVACGQEWKTPNVIGDLKLVREMQEFNRACTLKNTTWRLLFRDDKSIYLFASEADPRGRPLTIILPSSEKTTLVME
jgi:hypothetical protein